MNCSQSVWLFPIAPDVTSGGGAWWAGFVQQEMMKMTMSIQNKRPVTGGVSPWLRLWMILALLFLLPSCQEEKEDADLIMATDAAFFPYEYIEDGEIVGIDVDIVREVGRRIGKSIRIENMEFDSVIAAVQSGKVDFAASGITATEDRAKQVLFTVPYAVAQQVIIVPVGSKVSSADDLKNVKVGVQSGTTGDLYVTRNFGEPERYLNGALAIAALKTNKVAAVVLDNLPAEKHVAINSQLKILPEPLTEEKYAIALGKDKTALRDEMNAALQAMAEDGTLAEIASAYADKMEPVEEHGMLYNTFIKDGRWKYLVNGLWVTISISAAAAIIGIVLGALIGIIRSTADQTGRFRFLNMICRLYLTVVRGTPVVVQLLIIYFVIFGAVEVNKVLVAIIAFGLNSAAYVAEIIRSGIMSVDRGQMEAGRSLGLGYGYTMRSIIMPQAFKNVLPALGNEFIVLLKETSICSFIALQDLTKGGNVIISQTYNAFLPLLAVALIYLLLVVGLSFLLKKLEVRLKKNER